MSWFYWAYKNQNPIEGKEKADQVAKEHATWIRILYLMIWAVRGEKYRKKIDQR